MHRYFKIPPHLAERVGLINKPEKKLRDGNYMAFISHMKMLCPQYQIFTLCEAMGCLALRADEILDEMNPKGISRPLPEPTLEEYFAPKAASNPTGGESPTDDESVSDPDESEDVVGQGEPDMVFCDEDGEPTISAYSPISEEEPQEDDNVGEDSSEQEDDIVGEPNEEGGE